MVKVTPGTRLSLLHYVALVSFFVAGLLVGWNAGTRHHSAETNARLTKSGVNVLPVNPGRGRKFTLPDDMCIYIVIPYSRGNWTAAYERSFHDWSEDMMAGLRPAVEAGVEMTVYSMNKAPINLSPRFEKLLGGRFDTVAEKVDRRLASPDATNTTCKWIVQARVDADDYLGENFIPTLQNLLRHEITVRPTLQAAIVHQKRLTRVNIVPLPAKQFACELIKKRVGGEVPTTTTGFSLMLERQAWEKLSRRSVLGGPFLTVFDEVAKKFAKDFVNIPFPYDTVMMSPVTQLSSHYPWFQSGPFPPCNLAEMEEYFGPIAVRHLAKARIPRLHIVDACESNTFVKGILRKSTGKATFNCTDFERLWKANQTS